MNYMEIKNIKIDAGKPFDWGKVADDYAKYRDIYPEIFYEKIVERNLCIKGQEVLDLGTGTGVLPRNMYRFGAKWTGTDISENQIKQAVKLSKQNNMDIKYITAAAEKLNFPKNSFDLITAAQCYWYFDYEKLVPVLEKILKPNGRILFTYMAWLPFEDRIAKLSENLVLKYSPNWSGAGETVRPIIMCERLKRAFEPVYNEEYTVNIPFTKETWHGRIKACRGVGASLTDTELERWEKEHKKLLDNLVAENFTVKHYIATLELKLK